MGGTSLLEMLNCTGFVKSFDCSVPAGINTL